MSFGLYGGRTSRSVPKRITLGTRQNQATDREVRSPAGSLNPNAEVEAEVDVVKGRRAKRLDENRTVG